MAEPAQRGHIFDLMCWDSAELEDTLWWFAEENRRTARMTEVFYQRTEAVKVRQECAKEVQKE